MSAPTINVSLSLTVPSEGEGVVSKKINAVVGNTSERTLNPEDTESFDLIISDEEGSFIISGDRGEFVRVLKFLNIEKGESSNSGGF